MNHADKLRKLYGDDYFSRIGSKGGKNSPRVGNFVAGSQRAKEAGRKGGLARSRKLNKEQ